MGELNLLKTEFFDDSRHLSQDVHQLAVGVIEVFSKAMQRNDYPVGLAAIASYDRWISVGPNSLLRQTEATLCEAGEF